MNDTNPQYDNLSGVSRIPQAADEQSRRDLEAHFGEVRDESL